MKIILASKSGVRKQILEKYKIYSVIVTQKEKPVGLLRMHDILRSGIK